MKHSRTLGVAIVELSPIQDRDDQTAILADSLAHYAIYIFNS